MLKKRPNDSQFCPWFTKSLTEFKEEILKILVTYVRTCIRIIIKFEQQLQEPQLFISKVSNSSAYHPELFPHPSLSTSLQFLLQSIQTLQLFSAHLFLDDASDVLKWPHILKLGIKLFVVQLLLKKLHQL